MSVSAFAMYKKSKSPSKSKRKKHQNAETDSSDNSSTVNVKNDLLKKEKKRKVELPQETVQTNGTNGAESNLETGVGEVSHSTKKRIKSLKGPVNVVQTDEVPLDIKNISQSNESISKKATNLFKWLMHPMSPATFFETAWEQQPIFIARDDKEYYKSILTSSDIHEMLRDHPLYFNRNVDIVIYNDGVRETVSPDGRAKPSIVWDAYSKGHSVRILNPQTYNDKVHFILATFQEYFGTMVGANVYLTPAGSQGFAPHYDDIEAFIVQLEGKKIWKLYKPLTDAENLARFSSTDFTRDQLGDLVFEEELNAGDILYFPRGFVHEARTDDKQHSLHLTISTYQRNSYADLLEHMLPDALKSASENDIEFRKGLPINYLKHLGLINSDKTTPDRINMFKTIQKLFIKMVNYVNIDEAADKLGQKFMHTALPPVLDLVEQQCSSVLDGEKLQDGKLINKVSINEDTNIRLSRYYSCHMTRKDDEGILYFSTQNARVYQGEEEQYIKFDLELGSVIEILKMQYPDFLPVSSFPLEDKQKLLDFIMQLWDYGIITTQCPLT